MIKFVGPSQQSIRKWLLLLFGLLVVGAVAVLAWPHLSFLTSRDELRDLIVGAGVWAPLVYVFLQMVQIVIAPIPGTVISLAGGYIFETFFATLYTMIGTMLGFWLVFVISKRYGRRVMKYFVSPERVAKYDRIATSKGAFVFIAIGFLFPFIPDPVLGYIAGATPISTKVLMVISLIMRTPGVIMTTLLGSQVGQGNYKTVAVLIVLLVIVLLVSLIFYKQISAWADKLYDMAMRDNMRAHIKRRNQRVVSTQRKAKRRRRRKALTKKVTKSIKRPIRTRRRKTKHRR